MNAASLDPPQPGCASAPRVLVASAALVVAVSACTQFKDDGVLPSGLAQREAGPPCDPTERFGPASPVPGLTPDAVMGIDVEGVRLLPDLLTAYFAARGRPDSLGNLDNLYIAARWTQSDPFGYVQPVLGSLVNSSDVEMDPSVSGDGATLVFATGGIDAQQSTIEYAVRPSPLFPLTGVRPALEPNAGGVYLDSQPFLREDGQVLYFASDRVPQMGMNIFRSRWNGAAFGVPEPVESINSPNSDVYPVVTPNDLQIYFASEGHGPGEFDMWLGTRESTDQPFVLVRDLSELNSGTRDFPSFVTSDGCALYFTSERTGHFVPYVATKSAHR
jgi:hypothetical protein